MSGIKRTPADIALSKWVRFERDNGECQFCVMTGHPLRAFDPSSRGLDAAHGFTRRCGKCTKGGWKQSHGCARLDPSNVIAVCTAHHFHIDSHPEEKERLFRWKFGDEEYERVAALAHGKRDRKTA